MTGKWIDAPLRLTLENSKSIVQMDRDKWNPEQKNSHVMTFYYVAVITDWVTRPNKFTREAIRKIKLDMIESGFWKPNQSNLTCATVHVRNGDKWKEATLHNLADYIDVWKHYSYFI